MQFHTAMFWAVLGLVNLYAAWRGGSPERVAALLFACAALLSVALRSDWTARYRHVEMGVLAVDVALLIALTWLSLAADRHWPMLCTSVQAISLVSHLARWIHPEASRTAYMLIATASGTPSLLILAAGVLRHQRRMTASGNDNSWRTWWPMRRETPPKPRAD